MEAIVKKTGFVKGFQVNVGEQVEVIQDKGRIPNFYTYHLWGVGMQNIDLGCIFLCKKSNGELGYIPAINLQLIEKNNQIMEPKHTVSIDVPEGYKLIDKGNNRYEVVKKEQTLPKTWGEFCETHRVKDGEYLISSNSKIGSWNLLLRPSVRHEVLDKTLLPDKETAEAFLALMQLVQLRDCYNDGWKPDWANCEINKYVIINEGDELGIIMNTTISHILSFESKELAAEFLENFKDLIEIAKPLI